MIKMNFDLHFADKKYRIQRETNERDGFYTRGEDKNEDEKKYHNFCTGKYAQFMLIAS